MGVTSLCGIVDNLDGRWPIQPGASLRACASSVGTGRLLLPRSDPGAVRGAPSHGPCVLIGEDGVPLVWTAGLHAHIPNLVTFFSFIICLGWSQDLEKKFVVGDLDLAGRVVIHCLYTSSSTWWLHRYDFALPSSQPLALHVRGSRNSARREVASRGAGIDLDARLMELTLRAEV